MSIIESWLDDQNRPTTRRRFKHNLNIFLKWLQREKLFQSPEDLLKDYEKLGDKERYKHVEIVKNFLRYLREEKNYSINSRILALTSIRNLYGFNHTPFPKITRQDRRKMLEPTENEINNTLSRSPVKIKDLKDTLMETEEPYRTILQIIFQSGMGLAEFQYFNRHSWKQIKDQLDSKEPMKITLVRRKTSEAKVQAYYTFLGQEGKDAIKKWLRIRQEKYGLPKDDGPIFITISKRNGIIGAPANITIQQNLIHAMKKSGIIPRDAKPPYDLHPHELRDVFKSMCTLAGVKAIASEFFLGHSIDKLGYDKSPDYDEDFFKNEYLKVELKLNLWSQETKMISREEVRTEVIAALMGKMSDTDLGPIAGKLGISPQMIRAMIRRIGVKGSEEETEALLETERDARNSGNNNNHESKLITEEELCSHIDEGWDLVKELSNGKILVKKLKYS